MDFLAAAFVGYLIGAIPTANTIARLAGVDLRLQGSGNPGANNALQLGGPGLAAAVLGTEMMKGAGATLLGSYLVDEPGMVVAGLAALTGNLYNVFYRFKGGKGLGISAGIMLVAWPVVLLPILVIIAVSAWATRSSSGATLIAIAALTAMSLIWVLADLPVGWGIHDDQLRIALAFGMGILIWPRHQTGVRFRRQHPA